MNYDDHSPSSAAPVRARSNEPLDSASVDMPPAPAMEHSAAGHSSMDPIDPSTPRNLQDLPLPPSAPQILARIPDDLRVPWGWQEVALFGILGVIGSVVITRGMAEVAVRLFGVSSSVMFGETMNTAKSVVVLLSQAVIDTCAIVFLYLMLRARTDTPFWPTIGWHKMRPGMKNIRELAWQFLAGGALLAMAVTFAGGFFNSKETLPIEELLKARVSIVLFGMMGVLIAPLVEETIFRGFLYPVIARRWGVATGVAITGTLFGLMHAAQLWGGWGQIALLIFVGIVLTWVRARTGTVAASYFVHLGYNGLQLVGYLVYVISGAHR